MFYVVIITKISWVLSTCVLFIPAMHFSNNAQFSNITFILVLLASVSVASVFPTVIVPLNGIYASL